MMFSSNFLFLLKNTKVFFSKFGKIFWVYKLDNLIMKIIIMTSSLLATLTALAAPSAASAATEMKCGCLEGMQAKINGTVDGITFTCNTNDAYKTAGTDVSVQESDLKVYVDGEGAVQGDNDMNITFRSRDKKNLTSVFEANGKNRWMGSADDTKDIEVSGFSITGGSGSWSAGFKGVTSGKEYKGVVLFADLAQMNINPGKKTMTALCLENKD
jgi:hypothetical protein